MATVIKPKRSETASAIPAANSLAVGEIAMNVTDGKFYTKTSGNVVKEMGGAGSVTLQNVTTNGATTTTDILLVPRDGTGTTEDKVTLTHADLDHKNVMNSLVAMINAQKNNDPFVVVADAQNSIFNIDGVTAVTITSAD